MNQKPQGNKFVLNYMLTIDSDLTPRHLWDDLFLFDSLGNGKAHFVSIISSNVFLRPNSNILPGGFQTQCISTHCDECIYIQSQVLAGQVID